VQAPTQAPATVWVLSSRRRLAYASCAPDLLALFLFLVFLFLCRLGMNPNSSTPVFFTTLAPVTELVLGLPPRCLLLFSALDPPYGPVATESRHPPSPPSTTTTLVALLNGPPSSPPPPLPFSRFLVTELTRRTMLSEGRASVKALGWLATGWVQVEVGNRITRRMMWLPSGESLGGEPDPNPLGLGFASSSVGDDGSSLWWGVAGQSVIKRFAVLLVRGSSAGDSLPCSIADALTSPATVNGVVPSGGPPSRPRSTYDLGV
jgi:hypothetical protein